MDDTSFSAVVGLVIGVFVILVMSGLCGEWFNANMFKSNKPVSFQHSGIYYNAVFTPDTVKTFGVK